MLGKSLQKLIPVDKFAELLRLRKQARDGEAVPPFETVRVRQDGLRMQVSLSVSPILDDAGAVRGVASVFRNVTHQKRAEQDQRRLNGILESAPALVAIFDTERKLVYLNGSGRKMLRVGAAEDLGEITVYDLYPPEAHAVVRDEMLPAVYAEGLWRKEVRLRSRDGEEFPALVTASAHRGTGGSIESISILALDLAENKQLEEQYRQAQKLEVVGQLASGIAHDFNNILTVITGYAEMILGKCGADDPLRGQIEEVLNASGRAASLTRQLLAFSRKSILAPRLLDPNEVIQDVEKMLRRVIGEDIELATALHSTRPIEADPVQVDQVLMNLAVNARDAMPRGAS